MAKTTTAPKRKAAPKKKGARKKKAPAEQVNKSQAIRDYAEANPTVGPTDAAAALTEQGIPVSPAMVSQVKTKSKKKRPGKRRKKVAAAAPSAGDKIALSSLIQAKKLAAQLGGIEKARAALAALAKLQ